MRIDTRAAAHTPAPRTPPAEPSTTPSAAAPTPAPTTTPAPAAPPAHGKGAEHRSDVATLRQWLNHPDRRDGITLPDLTVPASHGHGFANAVAAYQAVLAELVPPTAEPPPAPAGSTLDEVLPTPTGPTVDEQLPAAPPEAPVVADAPVSTPAA
jgi:5'-nucleotidase